jgi:hypothetical protein
LAYRLARRPVTTRDRERLAGVGRRTAVTGPEIPARYTPIHAGRPQTNGSVERVQGTILQECWKPAFARYLVLKLTGLQRELTIYLKYYNEERAHRGRHTKGRTPLSVLTQAAGRPPV